MARRISPDKIGLQPQSQEFRERHESVWHIDLHDFRRTHIDMVLIGFALTCTFSFSELRSCVSFMRGVRFARPAIWPRFPSQGSSCNWPRAMPGNSRVHSSAVSRHKDAFISLLSSRQPSQCTPRRQQTFGECEWRQLAVRISFEKDWDGDSCHCMLALVLGSQVVCCSRVPVRMNTHSWDHLPGRDP